MKKIDLRNQQEILLEMLLCFDGFCRDNDLRYSLGGGTLLGAVRHKGFIPWDDDVDIMMPRKDYNIFVNLFNGSQPQLYCAKFSVADGCYFPYAKIYYKNTVLKEIDTLMSTPIFIDIFPIDAYPNSLYSRKIYIFSVTILKGLLHLKLLSWIKYSGFSIKRFLGKIVSSITPASFIYALLNALLSCCTYERANYLGVSLGRYAERECYPKYVFKDFVELEFEGHKVWAIREYDQYLRQHYGEYMKLPPPSNRVCSHTEYCYWQD